MGKDTFEFAKSVRGIMSHDGRYAFDAYVFIRDAVVYTARIREAAAAEGQKSRHISGQELLEGIKEYAIDQFGPMAAEVLRHWGITDSASIGDIVFNMVENSLLGKSERDRREDFVEGFDMDVDLVAPYRPEQPGPPPPVIDMV